MDLVTVASFSMQPEAQLAKNLLESEEIPAVLSEEVAGDMLHLGGEIKLMVPQEFVERAANFCPMPSNTSSIGKPPPRPKNTPTTSRSSVRDSSSFPSRSKSVRSPQRLASPGQGVTPPGTYHRR